MQMGLMTNPYHFIISNLDAHTIDLNPYKFGEANITTFRMINQTHPALQAILDRNKKAKESEVPDSDDLSNLARNRYDQPIDYNEGKTAEEEEEEEAEENDELDYVPEKKEKEDDNDDNIEESDGKEEGKKYVWCHLSTFEGKTCDHFLQKTSLKLYRSECSMHWSMTVLCCLQQLLLN